MYAPDDVSLAAQLRVMKSADVEAWLALIAAPMEHAERNCQGCQTNRTGEKECKGSLGQCAYSNSSLQRYSTELLRVSRQLLAAHLRQLAEAEARAPAGASAAAPAQLSLLV